jgi:hypothetical protein
MLQQKIGKLANPCMQLGKTASTMKNYRKIQRFAIGQNRGTDSWVAPYRFGMAMACAGFRLNV